MNHTYATNLLVFSTAKIMFNDISIFCFGLYMYCIFTYDSAKNALLLLKLNLQRIILTYESTKHIAATETEPSTYTSLIYDSTKHMAATETEPSTDNSHL